MQVRPLQPPHFSLNPFSKKVMAKKPPAGPPATPDQRPLLGTYADRCGNQYHIVVRPPHGFGLYPAQAPPDANYYQNDAAELRRLIGFGSFTRLPTT
jgi:hypothetical protein